MLLNVVHIVDADVELLIVLVVVILYLNKNPDTSSATRWQHLQLITIRTHSSFPSNLNSCPCVVRRFG